MANKAPSVALVISNQYENIPQIKLNGCYSDADNFINSIKKINPNTRFIIMRDNLPITSPLFPSKANIITQLNNFCMSPEIVSFLYYSGHGSSVNDTNKDESTDIIGQSNAIIQRKSEDASSGKFKDSCIVTNEGQSYGMMLDDEINNCFKKLPSNKRVYAFFDSCNSGTIIDLYSVYFVDPKNTKKFSASNVNTLLSEMKKPENNTSILNAYYPRKLNDIKGIIILISGTRDNTYSYEGVNLGKISGNLTSRLCWLLNNGVGKMNINDFYLSIVGLLNDPNQLPVLSCSKFISLTQTLMKDLDNGDYKTEIAIPFPMGSNDKDIKVITPADYESGTDYDTSDDEMSVIDQVNDTISTPVTETDNEIKNQLAIAEEQARKEAEAKEAELKAKQEAELKAKQEAELKAKQEAELKAKQEAELKAKQEAELKAKKEAELKAKQEAELKAKQEAELKAKQEAILKAKKEDELKAKKEAQAKREAQLKREAEAKERKEAEEKAVKEAEEKLKKETEEKLKKEADEKLKIQSIGSNLMLYKNIKQAALLNPAETIVIEKENPVKQSNNELIVLKAKQQAMTRVGLINQQKQNENQEANNSHENLPNVKSETISGSNYIHYLYIKKH